MDAYTSKLKQDLVVFAPKSYNILAEKNLKQSKTYKKTYEDIGVSKSMVNRITNLFTVSEENQFEIEAFYETTIWSLFRFFKIPWNKMV